MVFRTRWTARSGGPTSHPLFFVYQTPDGAQHMGNRDVHAPLPQPIGMRQSGYLMQNLAEEFGQFRPGPSREELNHMLNLPL